MPSAPTPARATAQSAHITSTTAALNSPQISSKFENMPTPSSGKEIGKTKKHKRIF
jgi:hypothetical protein